MFRVVRRPRCAPCVAYLVGRSGNASHRRVARCRSWCLPRVLHLSERGCQASGRGFAARVGWRAEPSQSGRQPQIAGVVHRLAESPRSMRRAPRRATIAFIVGPPRCEVALWRPSATPRRRGASRRRASRRSEGGGRRQFCFHEEGGACACSILANTYRPLGRAAAAPELAATRRPLRQAKRQPLIEECDVCPWDPRACARPRPCLLEIEGSANGYDCRGA